MIPVTQAVLLDQFPCRHNCLCCSPTIDILGLVKQKIIPPVMHTKVTSSLGSGSAPPARLRCRSCVISHALAKRFDFIPEGHGRGAYETDCA